MGTFDTDVVIELIKAELPVAKHKASVDDWRNDVSVTIGQMIESVSPLRYDAYQEPSQTMGE